MNSSTPSSSVLTDSAANINRILDILQASRPFGPDSNPAQRLVHAAVTQAGRDNTTALVIEAS